MDDRPASSSGVQAVGGAVEETNLYPPQTRLPYTAPPNKRERTPEDEIPRRSMDEISACASPASGMKHTVKRRKRSHSKAIAEDNSLAGMMRKAILDHQLGLSLNLMLLLAFSYLLFPSLRDRLSAFCSLSYPLEGQTGIYGQGPRDLYLVSACAIVFTAVRAATLDYILVPLGGMLGIRKPKARVRFAEQAFLMVYYSIYWTWGLYIFARDTPARLPQGSPLSVSSVIISLWTDFPRIYIDGPMKLYYLSQLAFWIQQILVIHIEDKRKDHYQMLAHHFVTIALIGTSYGYRHLRVGNAVLVLMDLVDVVFPFAKVLRYLGLQTLCDMAFGLFVFSWLIARHAGYLTICWSIYAHLGTVVAPYGEYSIHPATSPRGATSGVRLSEDGGNEVISNLFQPFLNPNARTLFFNSKIRWGFLILLLALQCITIMWFVMICRVVARVLRGEGADDSRSDDEGEEEDPIVSDDGPGAVQPSVPFTASDEKKHYIEVETSSADFQPRRNNASSASAGAGKRKGKGATGFSSGLNLGEKKDILNRIGCLSDEQLAREREKREGSEGASWPGSGMNGSAAKK